LLIWDSAKEERAFSICAFAIKIQENRYDIKQCIKVSPRFVNTQDSFIKLNGNMYKIWSNVIVGNKNIIAVEKYL
jgi:hypothetical protein